MTDAATSNQRERLLAHPEARLVCVLPDVYSVPLKAEGMASAFVKVADGYEQWSVPAELLND